MKMELHDYDIYPKVFPVGTEVEITVKPLGVHAAFSGEYKIMVQRLDGGHIGHEFSAWNHTDCFVTPCEDGCLRFTYTADKEGELAVRIYKKDSDRRTVQLNLYALDADMADRIPLRGDLHMHTCRSDGHGDPAIVCADYRMKGYDFIVVTDHSRYYPSLEAIRAYKDVDTALNILPGEEIHLRQTDVHIVNAGGLFSVNGLFDYLSNYIETNGDINGRRYDETVTPPDIVSDEQYNRALDEIEATLTDVPADANKRWYAVCVWAFNKIREAGGLGIFAHPYWISDMWQ
ncbi:MAG: PHP domain-containing protein, partial [Clostridia bacterium]|nr:PHP domain-containing protein [Clostridia bacterium]